MNLSRKALTFSIVYSIPLLVWLIAQLKFSQWNAETVHLLFQQTLATLVLLQAFTILLLFLNRAKESWPDELAAIFHILFFPLPFLILIWLTGSASENVIMKSLLLPVSVAAMVFIMQRGSGLMPKRQNIMEAGLSLLYTMLAVLLWNYRDLWLDWSGL